jgi:hypothetical protein
MGSGGRSLRLVAAAGAVLGLSAVLLAACGTTSTAAARRAAASPATVLEYVAGRFVPFESAHPLSPAQWAVVDAYARFTTAAVDVYVARSTAPLLTVVAPRSPVTRMFARLLATGEDPESLYVGATVEQVTITGCRARLVLELRYPNGRALRDVSSWVRPFDRIDGRLGPRPAGVSAPSRGSRHEQVAAVEHAPWLFVGDNRVGGTHAPCGI